MTESIPHLVSRIIYTGAGGFDNAAAGIQFMISPRVPHSEAGGLRLVHVESRHLSYQG